MAWCHHRTGRDSFRKPDDTVIWQFPPSGAGLRAAVSASGRCGPRRHQIITSDRHQGWELLLVPSNQALEMLLNVQQCTRWLFTAQKIAQPRCQCCPHGGTPCRTGTRELFLRETNSKSFGFGSHPVSLASTRLCWCSKKAAVDNMKMNQHSCVPIKFYWQKLAVTSYS